MALWDDDHVFLQLEPSISAMSADHGFYPGQGSVSLIENTAVLIFPLRLIA